VEDFILICGGFYPLQINLQGFSKPPQLELPQLICGDFC